MANVADNFIEYYKYMMKQKGKQDGESLEGVIQQRVGKGLRGRNTGKTRTHENQKYMILTKGHKY